MSAQSGRAGLFDVGEYRRRVTSFGERHEHAQATVHRGEADVEDGNLVE